MKIKEAVAYLLGWDIDGVNPNKKSVIEDIGIDTINNIADMKDVVKETKVGQKLDSTIDDIRWYNAVKKKTSTIVHRTVVRIVDLQQDD